MADSLVCPVPGCGRPIPRDKLMCARDWEGVPDHLRTAYLRALATYKARRSAAAAPPFLAARKAAIDSVSPRGNQS